MRALLSTTIPITFLLLMTAFISPSNAEEVTNPLSQSHISDTTSLIHRKGLPDLVVPVLAPDDSDRLLLYENESDTEVTVNYIYYVEAKGRITHTILNVERDKEGNRKESWLKDTLEDIEETVESIRQRKEDLNRNIAQFPGLNYFDRVDVLSEKVTLGLGKGPYQNQTTLILDTGKSALNFSYKVPFN